MSGSRSADVSRKGPADMSVSVMSAERLWMVMGRLDCWSRVMEFWKWRMVEGVASIVDVAPCDAKILAVSIIGIWWPPPTKGKKNILTELVLGFMMECGGVR